MKAARRATSLALATGLLLSALPDPHHAGRRPGRAKGDPQGEARTPRRPRGDRSGTAARVQEVPRRCPLPDHRRGNARRFSKSPRTTSGAPGSSASGGCATPTPTRRATSCGLALGGAAALRRAGVRGPALGPGAHVPPERGTLGTAQVPVHHGHLADRDLVLPTERPGRPRVLPALSPARQPAPLRTLAPLGRHRPAAGLRRQRSGRGRRHPELQGRRRRRRPRSTGCCAPAAWSSPCSWAA